MRRVFVITGAVVMGFAGGAAAAKAPTTAGNRAAAVSDTARLVTHVRLPHGSTASAHEPRGDHGLLSGEPLAAVTPTLVDSHRFFVSPLDSAATRTYILRHAPAQLTGEGSLNSQPTLRLEEFDLSARSGVFAHRQLVVSLVALSRGRTAVRVDAQDIYIVARSPSERIPGTATALTVSRASLGSVSAVNRTITDHGTINRIAALINDQPLSQPGTIACPMLPSAPTVTFTFRAPSGVVATASMRSDADRGGACGGGVMFTLNGRAAPLLEDGGNLLTRAGQLLGATLATSP